MNFIETDKITELDMCWIRKFKASKCIETLEIQVEGAERKINNDSELSRRQKNEILSAINTAYCVRENELKGF